ncbi:MAG TPA: pyridoxal phosphate-dependent aminotransferase [Planctomycetota bacterium]
MPSAVTASSRARRAAALQPSATLAMVARASALRAAGEEIFELTAGEPDFRPPAAAEEAAIAAIHAGLGRYTQAAGLPELRAAAARHIAADHRLEYAANEVVVTPGAKLGICQALMLLVDPGERVLIPSPFWTSYPEMVRIAEGVPVLVPCDAGNLPRVADLDAACTLGTVALMLNTPGNPTGAVYPRERLAEIGAWAVERGLWLISDEIYASLVYGNAQHVSPIAAAPGLRDRAIFVGGMSKAYAMTGWRMGFVAAPAAVARGIADLQSQLASSPPAISQYASLAALEHGGAERAAMRQAFEARRDLVVRAIGQMPALACAEPQGAFYAFPRLRPEWQGRRDPVSGRTIATGDDFAELLLELDRVVTIGGSAFGDPTAFRISFAAADAVLVEALQRIAARLETLA